ncbi:hypothetical protein [Okeania sp. KiyG1]|uniref:hypothetical protein n=1 Tax=Okeania sp. KiyG1 TaxID=2720165 RepID=UPI001920F848|nr:hypothetical protein [Okeania sp. KiyG1]GGA52221.1 hypothetical protein CYANOKiyG1_72010 [Okeania sp. KiyG1]
MVLVGLVGWSFLAAPARADLYSFYDYISANKQNYKIIKCKLGNDWVECEFEVSNLKNFFKVVDICEEYGAVSWEEEEEGYYLECDW